MAEPSVLKEPELGFVHHLSARAEKVDSATAQLLRNSIEYVERCAKYEEELKFYANPRSWTGTFGAGIGELAPAPAEVDRGKRARKALNQEGAPE